MTTGRRLYSQFQQFATRVYSLDSHLPLLAAQEVIRAPTHKLQQRVSCNTTICLNIIGYYVGVIVLIKVRQVIYPRKY